MAQRRALLIGVPEYRSSGIPPLPFIRNDMVILQAALESSDYTVQCLGIDKDASRGIIRSGIRETCQLSQEADTLFICFSGHGVHYNGSDFLVPHDADFNDEELQQTLVEIGFGKWIEDSKAKTILFFIDACREGIERDKMSAFSWERWSKGKIDSTRKRAVAYIFACGQGEFSYFANNGEQYSLFSHALAELIHANDDTMTFGEIEQELQKRLDRLSALNNKPRQKIQIVPGSETDLDEIRKKVIANSPNGMTPALPEEDPWVQASLRCTLWGQCNTSHPHWDALRQQITQIVQACRKQWLNTRQALPDDIWRDEQYPIRVLDKVAFIARLCEPETPLSLSLAEVAMLVAAPFLREGILAEAVSIAARHDPCSLKSTGTIEGMRGKLERTHLSFPQLIRKAQRLREAGKLQDEATIATWLMYRCLLRLPEVWMEEHEGMIPPALIQALVPPPREASAYVVQTLEKRRLIELARCIHGDPERVQRDDRPQALQKHSVITPSSPTEELVREKLLACILILAGYMAIDTRMLSEILVDHVGLNDPPRLDKLAELAASAVWMPHANGRALSAVCDHPALDLALREYVAHAAQTLWGIEQATYQENDSLSPLVNLPAHLLPNSIVPAPGADGRPLYETPHLRFHLAQNEIRELLMGEQLYGDPTLAIRELYQNALDACRYREARTTFLTQQGKYEGSDWEGRITFRQGIENGRHYIECEDNGIGMGRAELAAAFCRAGRRFTDMPEFIEEQAEWLQCNPPIRLYPNSQFGVGVFSYFMLADELSVETCRLDRKGRPGEQLSVRVSGSGSLFRVQPQGIGTNSGTRIKLYLSKLSYEEKYGGEKRISCLRTLKELLWVAQYHTEAHELMAEMKSQTRIWRPGVLCHPNFNQDRITPSSTSDVWWVQKGGRILADGIYTERSMECAVVNLCQAYRPKLTIDRRKPLEWNKAHVDTLMQNSVDVLFTPPGWLSINWLWDLEELNVHAAIRLVDRLRDQKATLKLILDSGHSRDNIINVPIAELGASVCDKELFEILEHVTIEEQDQSLTEEEGIELLSNLSGKVPDAILGCRARIWAKYGVKIPQWLMNALPLSFDGQAIPVLLPGDSLYLSNIYDNDEAGEKIQVSPVHFFCTAHKLGLPFADGVARFACFTSSGLKSSGLKPPEVDASALAALTVDDLDLKLLSSNLNARYPWLEAEVAPGFLCRATHELGLSLPDVLARLSRFTVLGLKLPEVDACALGALTVDDLDLKLLSRDLDGCFPWLEKEVTPFHLCRAAHKLGLPVADGMARLSRFAVLGLKLPEVDASALAALTVDDLDLKLLSRDLDGFRPWLETEVTIGHIHTASSKLALPARDIWERLRRFHVLGLRVPERPDD